MISMFDLLRTYEPITEEGEIRTAPLLLTAPPPCNTPEHQVPYTEKFSTDQLAVGASSLI